MKADFTELNGILISQTEAFCLTSQISEPSRDKCISIWLTHQGILPLTKELSPKANSAFHPEGHRISSQRGKGEEREEEKERESSLSLLLAVHDSDILEFTSRVLCYIILNKFKTRDLSRHILRKYQNFSNPPCLYVLPGKTETCWKWQCISTRLESKQSHYYIKWLSNQRSRTGIVDSSWWYAGNV